MKSFDFYNHEQVRVLCNSVVGAFDLEGNLGFDLLYSKEKGQPYAIEINPWLTAGVVSCAAAGVNLPYLGIKRLLGEALSICSPQYGTRMSRRYEESFSDVEGRVIEW